LSNFSSIGIRISSETEFQQWSQSIWTKLNRKPVNGGAYLVFEDLSGAAVYYQLDFDLTLRGFNPHFNGLSRTPFSILKVQLNPDYPLDGALFGWAFPDIPGDPDSGQFQACFELPNLHCLKLPPLPFTAEVALSAFADEVELFHDEAELRSGPPPHFAAESFFPTGLFNLNDAGEDESERYTADCLFHGRVTAAERRRNITTSDYFCWLQVHTMGGVIDVVCDPEAVSREPRVGDIARVSAWLSGRILSLEQ
jgi:hypothetical protein